MEPDSKSYKSLLWLRIFAAVAFFGLLVFWSIPNFVRGGPGKRTGIIDRLRQIEVAKEEWAIEHNITNATQLNRELTRADLIPYMLPVFTNNAYWASLYGEIYSIGRLNESAQAQLTRDLREYGAPKSSTLPKGTIIRLGTNGLGQYFLPGQQSNDPTKN